MRGDVVVAVGLKKAFRTVERRGLLRREPRLVRALDGVSFNVGRGELISIIGPNGAGKTTTVRILATLLLPDEGDAWVVGHHVVGEANKVRRSVGLMLYPDKGFFGRLTGLENLIYYGMMYGLSRRDARRRARELLEVVGLSDAAHRPYEEYSTGMKARLGIAKALIHDPPVLILDEPTAGIDPLGARKVRGLIRDLKGEGRTIVFTSHNLWEVEELSDKVAVLSGGRMAAIGTPQSVKERFGLRPRVRGVLRCPGEFPFGERNGDEVLVDVEAARPLHALAEIAQRAAEHGCALIELSVYEPGLEEALSRAVWASS